MHEDADAYDENEVVDDGPVVDLHLFEELTGLHVVTVGEFTGFLLAVEFRTVVAVNRDEEAVETRSEVRDVEEPSERRGRVHVADTEAEDREEHGYYRTGKHGDLQS